MTLSAKAKGKQRAVDPPLQAEVGGLSRELVIRFSEATPDLTLAVGEKDTVRDVTRAIRDARPQLKDRRIRLIHSGRLLTDGVLLYSWLTSLEERQRRAVVEGDSRGQPSPSPTTWLHCSVGLNMDSSRSDEGARIQTAQIQPARGFDRLAAMGFSASDIANFRREFHSETSPDYQEPDFPIEEDDEEHARALEEQWIDSLDNAGTATLSQSSSDSSLLPGIVLGFFFPILPIFFMWKPKLPVFWDDGSEYESPSTVIFSKRMQMGIAVGFVVNMLFGIWRFLLVS